MGAHQLALQSCPQAPRAARPNFGRPPGPRSPHPTPRSEQAPPIVAGCVEAPQHPLAQALPLSGTGFRLAVGCMSFAAVHIVLNCGSVHQSRSQNGCRLKVAEWWGISELGGHMRKVCVVLVDLDLCCFSLLKSRASNTRLTVI